MTDRPVLPGGMTERMTSQARTRLLDRGSYLMLTGGSRSSEMAPPELQLATGPSSPVDSIAGSAQLLGGTGTVHPGSVWIQVRAHVGGAHIAEMLAVVVSHLTV
jgi:hypothetical protein